jgi:O-antigen ligase
MKLRNPTTTDRELSGTATFLLIVVASLLLTAVSVRQPILGLLIGLVIFCLLITLILLVTPNKALFALFVFLIPFSVRLPSESLPFTLTALLLLFLIAKSLLASPQVRVVPNVLNWLVLLFIIWGFVTAVTGTDSGNSFRKLYNIIIFALVFWTAIHLTSDIKQLRLIYRALFASAICLAIIGLLQFCLSFILDPNIILQFNIKLVPIFNGLRVAQRVAYWLPGIGYPSNWYSPAFGLVRATGTTFAPMSFAQILLLSFFPILALLLTREFSKWRWIYLLLTFALGIAIFATLSRGAWLALGVGGLIIVYNYGRRPRQLAQKTALRLVITSLLFLSFILLLLPVSFKATMTEALRSMIETETIQERQFRLSNEARFQTYELGLMTIEQNPLFGVGLGNFAQSVDATDGTSTHNVYLNVMAEMGILGGLVYAGILLTACYNFNVVKNHSKQPLLRSLAVGWLASLFALMSYWFFTAYLYEPMLGMTLWLVLALSVVLRKLLYDERKLLAQDRMQDPVTHE